MIQLRHQERSLWEGLFAEEVADLWEPWMSVVDELLEDEKLLDAVYEAQGKRHPQSRTRGRQQTPAEVVLRMLILKHVRNWSYEVLEREVRANVVYRTFCRIGAEKVPDEKTLVRLGQAIGAETIRELHDRVVALGQERGVVRGRKLRVDTTVVESNIHYPTDSTLLGDGVRVLTRTMRKIADIVGTVGTRLRDRSRSVKLRVLDIARAARAKGKPHRERLTRAYCQLLNSTSRIVGQAKRFSREIAQGVKRAKTVTGQLALEALRQEIDGMVALVRQVMKQTRARILRGETRAEGKLLSLFEPTTEIIRKGKAAKPNEFGKMVKLQEAENQIVTGYEVYERRPHDTDLLIAAIEFHQSMLGRAPRLLAADAGFYSAKNEAAAKALGVKRVCIPNRATNNLARKREQKKRWFRNGQKWRTGCEGRISVVKRRHGLNRCRYKGFSGMQRWVGLGIIADNLVNIGRAIERRADP